MKDTSAKFEKMLEDKYRALTPDERIEMATSMFECAKEIVISSIQSENPGISERELTQAFIERFYGNDFPDLNQYGRRR